MKKLIALLGLLAIVAASVIPTRADVPLLYRTRFRPSTGCLLDGWLTDQGVTTETGNNPAITYFIFPGDNLQLIQTCACDGQAHAMGYTWIEVSTDFGATWGLVFPSFHQVMQTPHAVSENYGLDKTGSLVPLNTVRSCP